MKWHLSAPHNKQQKTEKRQRKVLSINKDWHQHQITMAKASFVFFFAPIFRCFVRKQFFILFKSFLMWLSQFLLRCCYRKVREEHEKAIHWKEKRNAPCHEMTCSLLNWQKSAKHIKHKRIRKHKKRTVRLEFGWWWNDDGPSLRYQRNLVNFVFKVCTEEIKRLQHNQWGQTNVISIVQLQREKRANNFRLFVLFPFLSFSKTSFKIVLLNNSKLTFSQFYFLCLFCSFHFLDPFNTFRAGTMERFYTVLHKQAFTFHRLVLSGTE